MASLLKKTEVKLELLTEIDMLLMVEKGIRGGICHAIHRSAKANNKYMKNYDKMKNLHFLNILMQTIYMVGRCQNHYLLMVLIEWKICLK